MGYCVASDVAALTPHHLSGCATFASDTNPTLTEVNAWISTGCGIIEASIGTRGYGAIPTTSAAYGIAAAANAFWGAYMTELSLISARVDRMENTRDERFKRAFDKQLEILMKLDLSVLGVSRSGIARPYSGGIRQTDKDNNDDGDVIQSRFRRGQFRNTDAIDPVATTPSAS